MGIEKPFALIIYGPTGVGKTDLTRAIAQHIPAEIINMDVGQFYAPFTIGTAKPDWRNESVPHHLFDIIDTPEDYTVVAYRNACIALVQDIWQRGKLPILVGGSGFYLRSLFFPPATGADGHHEIEESDDLWQQLRAVDLRRAEKIDPKDIYRIKRALAIWQKTGAKPSACLPQKEQPFDAYVLFLSRDRQELYERINQRVLAMLEAGWVKEIQAIVDTPWQNFVYTKRLIGYNELLAYHFDQSAPWELVVQEIQKRTRNYAKRQYTFWRMIAKGLATVPAFSDLNYSKMASIDLTLIEHDLYIRQLLTELETVVTRKKERWAKKKMS